MELLLQILPDYETMEFKDEVKNRDKRLEQTIRMGAYKRLNGTTLVPAPPVFSYTFTAICLLNGVLMIPIMIPEILIIMQFQFSAMQKFY